MTTTITRLASDEQVRFIASLAAERTLTDEQTADITTITSGKQEISTARASQIITALKALTPNRTTRVELEDGIYSMGGRIFKVQHAIHGSGHQYAKVLDTDLGSFEYAPGALRSLTPGHRLSTKEAADYGRLYGMCIVCGRTLTDEESIAQGIGPVCAVRV